MQSIADASADASGMGYKSGIYSYAYDPNGNMVTDNSKGLSITYNLLNLPNVNTLSTGTVTYTYDANGRKLRKVSTVGSGTTTDYIDGVQYTNNAIDFIQTEEGRALNSSGNYHYEYNLADHRLSYDTYSGAASTTQQYDYMPFGMEITAGTLVSPKNEYLYNKKELQEELGQYDYGARFYDPVIGRWVTVDPMAEQGRRETPYGYAFDDPMRFTDPDGMWPDWGEVKRAVKMYVGIAVAINYRMMTTGVPESVQNKTIQGIDNAHRFMGLPTVSGVVDTYRGTATPQEKAELKSSAIGMIEGGFFPGEGEAPIEIGLPKARFPEAAAHLEEAMKNGVKTDGVIDRPGATARRRSALKDTKPQKGLDRDEVPPAVINNNNGGSSVKHISPSDNRGAGAYLSHKMKKLPNGTSVKITVKK